MIAEKLLRMCIYIAVRMQRHTTRKYYQVVTSLKPEVRGFFFVDAKIW
jgi:hypothetical protein